jgi:hypothetical protein
MIDGMTEASATRHDNVVILSSSPGCFNSAVSLTQTSSLSSTYERAVDQVRAFSRAPIIDAESACAVRHDLQQTTCHHEVFNEVKRLVWIRELSVKEHRCGQAKQSEYGGDDARLIAEDNEEAAADFDGDSPYIGKRCGQGERRGPDKRSGRVVSHDFAYSAHHKWQADEQAANKGKISSSVHMFDSDFRFDRAGSRGLELRM